MARVSNWRAYAIAHMDRQTLAAIIAIVERFLQQWGRAPTPEEVWAELTGPR